MSELRKAIHDEFKRCAVDCVHFLKKYTLIQHPVKGRVKFNLYPFQEQTLKHLQTHRFNIINKSRQMGISQLSAGYALHCLLFNSDFKILVIATKQDVARNLVQKVQFMHDSLPAFLRGNVVSNNKLSISFANGSSIKAVSSSPDAARSEALSLLIMDEAAHMPDADEIWGSAKATLATGGNAIILSTPNGVGNLFHKLWVSATTHNDDGVGLFNPIELPWHLHPDRDDVWFQTELKTYGKRWCAQEYECNFESSGHTVIESETLLFYQNEMVQEPIERRGIGGDYWIWKYPNYQRSYIVVADVARGDGADFSTFHVIDIENVEQVAEFRGKVDTDLFGHMLVAAATEYNNALLVIDNKNIGWSTVQIAINLGYKNLYYSYKHDPYTDESIQLMKRYDLRDKSEMVPGFTTTTAIRPVLISKLDMYMRERSPIIRSSRFIHELFTFIWLNGKPQAATGYNDDLTMAFCIGLYIRDTALKLRQLGIDLTNTGLRSVKKTIYTPPKIGKTNWEMQVTANKKEPLNWLL